MGNSNVLTKPVAIPGKIVGFRVLRTGEAKAPQAVEALTLPDEDPRTKPVAHRPEGFLRAYTCKIVYFVYGEKQKLYFMVSFLPVIGRLKGHKVRIERPIEMFIPDSQQDTSAEWIGALMRSLSFHARAGTLPEVLANLREVEGQHGTIQLNSTPSGKNKLHNSVVGAVVSMIQELLMQTGFLDEYGRLNSLDAIQKTQASNTPREVDHGDQIAVEEIEDQTIPEDGTVTPQVQAPFGFCKEKMADGAVCDGVLELRDHCLTCPQCGYSKCS